VVADVVAAAVDPSDVLCPFIFLPDSTQRNTDQTYPGLTVVYSCPQGFQFDDGSSFKVMTCLPMGIWSTTPDINCARKLFGLGYQCLSFVD